MRRGFLTPARTLLAPMFWNPPPCPGLPRSRHPEAVGRLSPPAAPEAPADPACTTGESCLLAELMVGKGVACTPLSHLRRAPCFQSSRRCEAAAVTPTVVRCEQCQRTWLLRNAAARTRAPPTRLTRDPTPPACPAALLSLKTASFFAASGVGSKQRTAGL